MSAEKNTPKYRTIADAIRLEMISCKKSGIPYAKTQLELADEFGVNRQTVRHALDWLERHHSHSQPDHTLTAGESEESLPKIGFPLWVHSLEALNVAGMEYRLSFAKSISAELANFGLQLDLQCVGPQRSPNLKKIARLCEEWQGVFLEPNSGESAISPRHPFAALRDRTVVIGTLQDTHHNSVCPDFYSASQLAMEELIRCGARRILYTGPRDDYQSHMFVRIAGAEKIVERYPGVEMLYTENGSSSEKAFSVVKRFFLEGGKCDAVLASTAYASAGAIRAMADLGIRVPDDVQLISIGQTSMMTYMVPKPSAVVESGKFGLAAAGMMEALLRPNARPQPNILIPMQLIKGETTREATIPMEARPPSVQKALIPSRR